MPDTHRARQSLHRVSDLIGIPFRLLRRWEAWKFLSPMTACPHLDALWCFRYPWYLHKWKSHEISSSKRFGRGPSSGALEAWRIKFQMFKPTEPVQHQKMISVFSFEYLCVNSGIPALHSFILNCCRIQDLETLGPKLKLPAAILHQVISQQRHNPET